MREQFGLVNGNFDTTLQFLKHSKFKTKNLTLTSFFFEVTTM